jgi:dTDP-4-amino-4,6-dideoxygalactose transaminase
MIDSFRVVRDFEAALCEYTGAKYAVAVNSCTAALFLALRWEKWDTGERVVAVPSRTYPSVPMVVIQAGHRVRFEDYEWQYPGSPAYSLSPFDIWDCARWFRRSMYRNGSVECVSFHPQKCLALSTGGGAILHDNPEADAWFRRARFDGRHEGVPTKDDTYDMLGWHMYMMPAAAAEGLQRLSVYREVVLPKEENYPDLSKWTVFTEGGRR